MRLLASFLHRAGNHVLGPHVTGDFQFLRSAAESREVAYEPAGLRSVTFHSNLLLGKDGEFLACLPCAVLAGLSAWSENRIGFVSGQDGLLVTPLVAVGLFELVHGISFRKKKNGPRTQLGGTNSEVGIAGRLTVVPPGWEVNSKLGPTGGMES